MTASTPQHTPLEPDCFARRGSHTSGTRAAAIAARTPSEIAKTTPARPNNEECCGDVVLRCYEISEMK
jgi:hypothetical protein